MHLVQKSSDACWSSTGTMTFPTRVIMMSPQFQNWVVYVKRISGRSRGYAVMGL
jgi:hypothetical protein